MDRRVKDLVDFSRDKWGLENYYLYTYHFYRTLNALNETTFTLCMEWYPSHINHQEDEDCNPEGTAVIELNIKNYQFEKVIFVGGKNFTNRSVISSIELNDIIKFIESETGLKSHLLAKKHFNLYDREEKSNRVRLVYTLFNENEAEVVIFVTLDPIELVRNSPNSFDITQYINKFLVNIIYIRFCEIQTYHSIPIIIGSG